ncbi:hypothetical protein, variant [Saprolegnia diclina VS20]|uniref:PUB domain-containing protein n=1 Tax=Saprolegnia diclina (strain VS20) TaxID=1156394 RepID=T0Q4S8_SAPDV|nr:hypothetical protein, variant [Saprolegnia diclina VS20]EQC29611.1 hypothetical protein, variant [Saprolegnia diclina VS20]|eukprot:XP_008616915.1 hypothetical protein, variant [Saprolegnia diclina VS20]
MELKRLTTTVDDAEVRLRDLVASRTTADAAEEARVAQRAALHALLRLLDDDIGIKMDKFMERLAWADPVTNEPRYGPVMQDKIRAVHARVEALRGQLVEIRDDVETDGVAMAERLEQRRLDEQRRADEAAREALDAAAKAAALAHEAEQERIQAEAAAKAREVERLAIAAQKVRDERARKAAEEEARIEAERAALAALQKRVVVGLDGLTPALATLHAHIRELPNASAQWRQTLSTLHVFLQHICSAPDNAVFRQIKESNPFFMADVGQFPGGRDALLAMGFALVQQDGVGVYLMEEPDLAADMDKWSDWFDALKSMRDFVETLLAQPLPSVFPY